MREPIKKVNVKIALLMLAFIIGFGIARPYLLNHFERKVEPFEVWNKAEKDGRCFVQVWIEVTPEEYIGLDIGDEYEVKE